MFGLVWLCSSPVPLDDLFLAPVQGHPSTHALNLSPLSAAPAMNLFLSYSFSFFTGFMLHKAQIFCNFCCLKIFLWPHVPLKPQPPFLFLWNSFYISALMPVLLFSKEHTTVRFFLPSSTVTSLVTVTSDLPVAKPNGQFLILILLGLPAESDTTTLVSVR